MRSFSLDKSPLFEIRVFNGKSIIQTSVLFNDVLPPLGNIREHLYRVLSFKCRRNLFELLNLKLHPLVFGQLHFLVISI